MSESQRWFFLAVALLLGALLYLLAPVLTPFLIGAILAYIGDPLVDRLESWRLSRNWSVTLVFLVMTAAGLVALLVLLPLLQRQFVLLISKLPSYIDWAQEVVVPWLREQVGVDLGLEEVKASVLEHWQAAGGAVVGVLGTLSRSGLTVIGWAVNLLLIPVVTFYMLRDWDAMVAALRELLPRRMEADAVRITRSVDDVLGAFFRGQLTVMLALGTIYSVGLSIIGLDLALLIGMLSGLVSFVPYLGSIVGIAVAGLAATVQFQEWLPLVYVAAVFGVGQLIEGMVLTPLLLGDRIGLHPVMVIFAVLAGGQLFGFFGVLLALPVAAVVAVLARYAHERYRESHLYRGAGVDR